MGYIYIIKNSVSTKVYVGATKQELEKRFAQHKSDFTGFNPSRGSSSRVIFIEDSAGTKIEKVCECLDEHLDELEKFYISTIYKDVCVNVMGSFIKCSLCDELIREDAQTAHESVCKKRAFECKCGKKYINQYKLNRHMKESCKLNTNKEKFICEKCGEEYTCSETYRKHIKNIENCRLECLYCDAILKNNKERQMHELHHKKKNHPLKDQSSSTN